MEVPLCLWVQVHLGLLDEDRPEAAADLTERLEDADDERTLHSQPEILTRHVHAGLPVDQAQGREWIRRVSEPEAHVDVRNGAPPQKSKSPASRLRDHLFNLLNGRSPKHFHHGLVAVPKD